MATNTWIAAASGNASVDGNWSLGHAPAEGEDIVFDGTSVNNCSWDVTAAIGSFSMSAGYTGTVTQACEVTISGDCTIAAGTLTGDATNWFIIGGNVVGGSGTVTSNVLKLEMTGTEKTISKGPSYFKEIKFSGSITNTIIIRSALIDGSKITVSGNLIMGGSISSYSVARDVLIGTITSTGSYSYYAQKGYGNFPDHTGNLSGLNIIFQYDGATSGTYILTGNLNIATLIITHPVAGYTVTLDCDEYNLSCTDFTEGTRGCFKGGSGTHTISGSLDAVATGSDFDPETSTVILSGASKTVELQAADSFYNLTVSGSYTMDSDITVTNEYVETGSLALNSNTFTLNNATGHTYYSYPSKATTIDGGGLFQFYDCDILSSDITITSGSAYGRTKKGKAWSAGDMSASDPTYLTNYRHDMNVVSGTFTVDIPVQMKDLDIDSGATLVQSHRMYVCGKITNDGTLTANYPNLIAIGRDYAVVNPPINIPVNAHRADEIA